jgi:small subunit ribosomal protein S11
MSRTITRRLLARTANPIFESSTLATPPPTRCIRLFSRSLSRTAEDDNITPPSLQAPPYPAGPSSSTAPNAPIQRTSPSLSKAARVSKNSGMSNLLSTFGEMARQNTEGREQKEKALYETNYGLDGNNMKKPEEKPDPHHFHVYATRHNTHVTLTDPKRNPIISLSCGNLGFRHSARKHYDSAFQLASHVMQRMQDRGINPQIKELEVVLRGFGAGREAVTKAILGLEGKQLRHKIVKVADATRLKFGGTRSKKPRRLG